MSKATNVRLLTSCIVSALHPNQAIPEGTVYNPADFGDFAETEAKQLVLIKLAERTSDKVTWTGTTLDSGKPHVSGLVENDDAALKKVLEGSVAEVEEAIESGVYNAEQIKRLGELNTLSEKPRAGVEKAVDAYAAANEAE